MHCKIRHILMIALYILGLCGLPRSVSVAAQGDSCDGVRNPFMGADICAEFVLKTFAAPPGVIRVGALVFTPDDTLYFASPAHSAIFRMRPDLVNPRIYNAPELWLALSEPPIGLTYDVETNIFYASADTIVFRISPKADGTAIPQAIVTGLPGGAGGWLGNIRLGPDRRLYVAKASRCDTCTDDDPRRAALLSFTTDGQDMRIVARGLRNAFDFAFDADGAIYIVDAERDNLPAELNVIPPNTIGLDFGFPTCGHQTECAGVTPPAFVFSPASAPAGILFYQSSALPKFQGLLVGLAGSLQARTITGYEVQRLAIDEQGRPTNAAIVIPDYLNLPTADSSLIRASFYPYRITGMAVDSRGWLYTGLAEGRIYRFKPRPPNAP
jgi:glucose/arabinose dehydrogenase